MADVPAESHASEGAVTFRRDLRSVRNATDIHCVDRRATFPAPCVTTPAQRSAADAASTRHRMLSVAPREVDRLSRFTPCANPAPPACDSTSDPQNTWTAELMLQTRRRLQRGVSDHVAWPQAWQAKRPFRVVAHATGLLLATAPAVAPPGGRHRAPPDDDGL